MFVVFVFSIIIFQFLIFTCENYTKTIIRLRLSDYCLGDYSTIITSPSANNCLLKQVMDNRQKMLISIIHTSCSCLCSCCCGSGAAGGISCRLFPGDAISQAWLQYSVHVCTSHPVILTC